MSTATYKEALFDVQRSIRYHDQRKAFFEQMHRVTSVLTIFMAGSVIYTLAMPSDPSASTAWWFHAFAITAAALSAFDLIVGYSSKAALHKELRDDFSDLEVFLAECGPEKYDAVAVLKKRAAIERNEPAVYCALDLVCYNEVVRANYSPNEYPKHLIPLKWLPRMTRHWLQWKTLGT